MEELHERFGSAIRRALIQMADKARSLRQLKSAQGCVKGRNSRSNARIHSTPTSRWWYITDFRAAYDNVDIDKLALLLTYISNHRYFEKNDYTLARLRGDVGFQDEVAKTPGYRFMKVFLVAYFSGKHGKGLATGANLSPYLLNLYCEFWLDEPLRKYLYERKIVYTRFVDDLAFSKATPLTQIERRHIRSLIEKAGFAINHRKTYVLSIDVGEVTLTGMTFKRSPSPFDAHVPVYPLVKRRRLEGILKSYIPDKNGVWHMDWPKKCVGVAAGFIEYLRTRYGNLSQPDTWTNADRKTYNLCRKFMEVWQDAEKGGKRKTT